MNFAADLLRARDQRQIGSRAANEPNELAPPHGLPLLWKRIVPVSMKLVKG